MRFSNLSFTQPTSGLYFDTKSRYYYAPQHDLYYDGNNGNWLRLNPRTNEFIFHSGSEASQAVKKVLNLAINLITANVSILSFNSGSMGEILWFSRKRF